MTHAPEALEDVGGALALLMEAIVLEPPHVRSWLRPIADEIASTQFKLDSAQRRRENHLAQRLWDGGAGC